MSEPHTIRVVHEEVEYGPACEECDGWGGWTETRESGGRDIEIDIPCHHCGGTGRL
jgi:DnaJ-class molecular chaperone